MRPDKECVHLLHNDIASEGIPRIAVDWILSRPFVLPARYTILNDSANHLMLLFCKQINTVQKSCYAARRGIGHLPYKLLSHRSVKRTPAAIDNESEENRRARRIP